MEAHRARTEELARQIKVFHECRQPFRVYHGSSNSTRRTVYDRKQIVDTSGFNHVIEVSTEKLQVIAEPNVSMGKLVDACLPYGLVPAVVPEFPAITIGGAFAGTAGESSSFRHGFVDKTVSEIDIILSTGEIMKASPHQNADLYHGAAGSFGTLGVLSLCVVKLIPAQQYIEVTYHPITDSRSAVKKTEELADDESVFYLDGILFGNSSGVIMSGRFTDKLPPSTKPKTYSKASDTYFYSDARKHSRVSDGISHQYIPTREYLFRYDRGAFWTAKWAFKYFKAPYNRVFRRILDGLLHTEIMYHALHKSGMADKYIIQDIGFPYEEIPAFIDYLDQNHGFYPIWLCPLLLDSELALHPRDPLIKNRLMNVGLWGPGPTKWPAFVEANRQIEQKTKDLHGLKCLYAHAYYTEDEFWQIYNKDDYDALREKYQATSLPSVYQKVSVSPAKATEGSRNQSCMGSTKAWAKEIWPLRGLYGMFAALSGKSYLMSEK